MNNGVEWDPYLHKIEYCSICGSQHTWCLQVKPRKTWVCMGCFDREILYGIHEKKGGDLQNG